MTIGEYEEEGRPWTSGEGYSPLIGSNSNMMAMAYGDSSESGESNGIEADFDRVDAAIMMEDSKPDFKTDDDDDILTTNYAMLADQALAALEADYLATLRLEDGRQNHIPTNTDTDTTAQIPQYPIVEQSSEVTETPSDEISSPIHTDRPDLFPKVASACDKTVDTEKVRKAVESIRVNNSKLKSNYELWDLDQKKKAARESISRTPHTLIPEGPLRAFLKETTKAKDVTHTLSRSATIAEALVRLNVLGAKVFEDTWSLDVHVIGCDQVECETQDRIQTYFQPLVRWIGGQTRSPTSMHLSLVGPGIVGRDGRVVNLLPTTPFDRLQVANASCHCALYEDWLPSQTEQPDLIIAFNAGIWGYGDWCATVRTIAERKLELPLVITAYTLQEAEDDYDALKDEITRTLACSKEKTDLCCIWEPEVNPFASKIDRPTQSAPEGRQYRENQAWQAWRL